MQETTRIHSICISILFLAATLTASCMLEDSELHETDQMSSYAYEVDDNGIFYLDENYERVYVEELDTRALIDACPEPFHAEGASEVRTLADCGGGGTSPPTCPSMNVYIGGETSQPLFYSRPFSAVVSGGSSPFTYSWAIRHFFNSSGWSAWGSFSGGVTIYAGATTPGITQFQLRVTVHDGCGNQKTAYKTVYIY